MSKPLKITKVKTTINSRIIKMENGKIIEKKLPEIVTLSKVDNRYIIHFIKKTLKLHLDKRSENIYVDLNRDVKKEKVVFIIDEKDFLEHAREVKEKNIF
ncbi:MAG: hypothetical protein HFG28_16275 [Eubacterium sp.]|nr:hypothetical protein [Eubacterium sp.]